MDTIENLQQTIEALQAEIDADMKRLIEPKRRRLSQLKSSLKNNQVEAWFEKYPEQRISIGDAIIVTSEFNDLMTNRNNRLSDLGTQGNVVGFNFPLNTDRAVSVETSGWRVGIPLDVALRMRKAWLSKQRT